MAEEKITLLERSKLSDKIGLWIDEHGNYYRLANCIKLPEDSRLDDLQRQLRNAAKDTMPFQTPEAIADTLYALAANAIGELRDDHSYDHGRAETLQAKLDKIRDDTIVECARVCEGRSCIAMLPPTAKIEAKNCAYSIRTLISSFRITE